MILPTIWNILNNKISKFRFQEINSTIYFYYTYLKENVFIIPEYQRNFVWSLEQQENLIRSIFYWISIPPLILNINEDTWEWTVIDWQQRLTTLKKFLNNELEVDWYIFDDLSNVEKRNFLNNKLGYLETNFKTLEEEKWYYYLFNTSWTLHTKEDLNI